MYYANSRADAAAIGFDDSLIYDEMAVPLESRRIPMRRTGASDDALAVFREWQAKEDKVPY